MSVELTSIRDIDDDNNSASSSCDDSHRSSGNNDDDNDKNNIVDYSDDGEPGEEISSIDCEEEESSGLTGRRTGRQRLYHPPPFSPSSSSSSLFYKLMFLTTTTVLLVFGFDLFNNTTTTNNNNNNKMTDLHVEMDNNSDEVPQNEPNKKQKPNPSSMIDPMDGSSNSGDSSSNNSSNTIRVAHIGNSIQYYNDCPRLLQHMLATYYTDGAYQNSCLRGGATLPSILIKGNGMKTKFSSRPNVSKSSSDDGSSFDIGAPTVQDLLLLSDNKEVEEGLFDVVILNDHTQSPARLDKRQATIDALKTTYIPLFQQMMQQQKQQQKQAKQLPHPLTIIFIQTAAYRRPVKDSQDLGTFDDFTKLLSEGYQSYADVINNNEEETSSSSTPKDDDNIIMPTTIQAKIAPVGIAYQYLRNVALQKQQQQQQGKEQKTSNENDDDGHNDITSSTSPLSDLSSSSLWSKLYANDDFHPSPLGTYLEACVLYCTITGQPPPSTYNIHWWDTARYMQPPPPPPPSPSSISNNKDHDNNNPLSFYDPLPLPTNEEAMILRDVACRVCLDHINGCEPRERVDDAKSSGEGKKNSGGRSRL